jgi:hypothetical protein
VGVVGAGPAGICAALAAAARGAQVLLFDTNAVIGRKLLVTGNGRCNISNLNASADRYVCADPAFLRTALALHGPRQTLSALESWGVLTYATPDGWCYPLSESAAGVAAALASALEVAGVETRLSTRVHDLTPEGRAWRLGIGSGPHALTVDRVVVAAGGKAYPALGSRGDLFPVLQRLGHAIARVRPALAPLITEAAPYHAWQGVRLDVGLALYEGEALLGRTVGNCLFTQTGLSGPAPMDLSHLVSARPGADLRAEIDLLPTHRGAVVDLVQRHRAERMPLAVALGAALAPKAAQLLVGMAGLPAGVTLAETSDGDLARALALTAHLPMRVTGTKGFDAAQVSAGGVLPGEVEPSTMESRLRPGLHLAGEVLDVIGPCGGYNLQWACTSGALAGAGAASRD